MGKLIIDLKQSFNLSECDGLKDMLEQMTTWVNSDFGNTTRLEINLEQTAYFVNKTLENIEFYFKSRNYYLVGQSVAILIEFAVATNPSSVVCQWDS